jgi:hypothetical protein
MAGGGFCMVFALTRPGAILIVPHKISNIAQDFQEVNPMIHIPITALGEN